MGESGWGKWGESGMAEARGERMGEAWGKRDGGSGGQAQIPRTGSFQDKLEDQSESN